jgi:cytochrome c peroxidase
MNRRPGFPVVTVAALLSGAVLLALASPTRADKVEQKPAKPIAARALDLPSTPWSYSKLPLPAHFQTAQIRRSDNTPSSNPITDDGATLGRVLFYDSTLSLNGKISCASCHLQSHAFADPNPLSIGFEGKKVNRNAMSLINLRYYGRGRFFWDERARTLEEQVLMPIENKIEMGHNLKDLVRQLSNDPIYPPLFSKAFGNSEVTEERMARALAQFLRSIVSYRSKYDEGLAKTSSIRRDFPNFTEEENEGKRVFLDRGNCASCHMAGGGGGRGGRSDALFFMGRPRNNGVDVDVKGTDGGIAEITLNINQLGQFKSPDLRNVELTGPYMHDGRFKTLEEVVDHYNKGVKPHPFLDGRLRGRNQDTTRQLNLSDRQKRALVAFMKTLTDRELTADPKYSNPFRTPADK